MATNPLYSPANKHQSAAGGRPDGTDDARAAADLIRQKVARLYDEEPGAAQELTEARVAEHRSKHQQFMYELGTSGKDLATIQTEWHNYYQGLPDAEKHQVWHEFYASQPLLTGQPPAGSPSAAQQLSRHKQQTAKAGKLRDARSSDEVRTAIRHKVSAGGKLSAKHNLQSLLFGLGMGLTVLIIFLFGFFNEVVVAPFIQPSRNAKTVPLVVGNSDQPATSGPEVVIPKINVQIPVIYGETSTDTKVIENALDNGVVHYPTTTLPGQSGNAAFFGHSSNNIFNKGKYKFAFVLLHKLQTGDTFYLSYSGTMYVYKVISRDIVPPSRVDVLNAVPGQTATATLITCDPPGTSLNRLVVVGQQVSPDPSKNIEAATSQPAAAQTTSLPGNGQTLWGRFISTAVGKIITIGVAIAIGGLIIRRLHRQAAY